MCKVIMAGCDLHDKTIVLAAARGRQRKPELRTLPNSPAGRRTLLAWLHELAAAAGGKRIVLAYEASSLGFGLCDELRAQGVEGYVLAPTRIARSSSDSRNKHDRRDAMQLLEIVRSHVLAGNELHAVWVPSHELRDDRELVRARLEAAGKSSRIKAQIRSLLKRNTIERPESLSRSWTKLSLAWLRGLAADEDRPSGLRVVLASLLRQLQHTEAEINSLEEAVGELAATPRYQDAVHALCLEQGVAVLTAMVFLTEIGDPRRFNNRRQVAAYFGLTPMSHESGERNDHKGHITRQGSGRMRRMLCQAMWARLRYDADEKERYARLTAKNPKHKKIAVVAGMRRLVIRMWHHACDAGSGPVAERLARRQTARLASGSTEGGTPLAPSGLLGPQSLRGAEATAKAEGARGTPCAKKGGREAKR